MLTTLRSARTRIFYGWWIVAASAGITWISSATIYFGFSTLVDPLIAEFGWSTAATSAAISLQSQLGAFAGPLVGAFIDRFGSRWSSVAGILLVTVGLLCLGLIDSLWQFYLAFVLISLGISSAGGSVGTVAVSWWFVRQRSRALSLFFIGPGLAGITVRLLAWLVEQFGWRHAVQGWGVIVLLACLPMTLLLRERPEKYGLTPDGDAPHRTADGATPAPVANSRSGISFRQALRMSHYWKLGVVFALTGLSATPVIILVIPALTNVGVSYETAAWVAAGVPLVSLAGRLGVGWWGDFYDKRKLVAGCFVLQGVGVFLLSQAGQGAEWLLAPFILLFAIGFGGPIPLRGAILADYFGTAAMGSIQGLLLFFVTLGGLLGPVTIGAIVDQTGSYRAAFMALSVCSFLAVPVMMSLPKVPARGRRSAG